jgi:predicted dehydrogenase
MTYRAGIIGTGGIAATGILGLHDEEAIGKEKVRASHAGGYEAAEDVDLVAIADVDEEKPATDVIWCEKSIASQGSAAEEMIETCAETDTDLVVNHSFRFTDDLRTLRRLIQEHVLGEVHSVATHPDGIAVNLHAPARHARLPAGRPGRLRERARHRRDRGPHSLEAAQAVDVSGGGSFVGLDEGTFPTVDCTVPRNDSR